MDIFSTIGAAVQLIETVKKVIAIINTIRHARNRADELCLELQQLDSNLQAVRDLLATKDRLNFHQTSILVSGAACCDSKLKNLLGDLEMVQTSKRERSKWALKDERYHDMLQNIRAFSNTLHFAISFDSICLLTKSAEEAEEAFRIQEQSLHVLRSSHLITTRIEHKVDEGIIQWKASEALRRREKLLALIDDRLRMSGSTSQEYRHDKFRQSRSKRTGLWFLMEPKFMRWTRSNTRLNVEVPHSRNFGNMEVARDANQYELEDMHVSASLADAIFLCQGPPGSGKSTLASLVVDSLCTSHNEEIGHCVYYYFDYNDEQDQLGLDLVLCFLRQIVQGSMTTDFQLPYTINQLEKEFLEPRGVKIESVCSFLHDIIRAHDVFYIVLDALDEIHTSNRSVILSLLSDLAKISSVKIFATSRQASDLGSLFLSSTAFEFRALDTDIQYYLRDEIAKANLSESHPIDEKLKDDIIAHILKIANGMFLLAKLSLKCVLDGASPGARRDALRKMPRDLPSYFEKTLNRIWNQPPDRRVIAANTLFWIIHLRMLPSVEQMRDALSIDLEGQRQLSHDYRPTLATILGCCHGFVRVGADDRLLFTHKAVHDFLCETMTFDRKLHLARLTIRYIQDPAFNGGPVSNPESYRREYPFLDCLALRWIRLLKDGLKDGGDDWSELFQTKPNLAFMYQYSYWRRGYNERYCAIEEARSVTPLMLACKVSLNISYESLHVSSQTHSAYKAVL